MHKHKKREKLKLKDIYVKTIPGIFLLLLVGFILNIGIIIYVTITGNIEKTGVAIYALSFFYIVTGLIAGALAKR